MFPHEFANVYDFSKCLVFIRRVFGTLQSYIQMRSSDERTGRKNSRTVIFKVRVLSCICSRNFRECLRLLATLDIDYSLPFGIFAVLHTNESSSSVDTHLAEIIRVHLGYLFAVFNAFAD